MFREIIEQYQGEMKAFRPYATIEDREAWEKLDPEWKKLAIEEGEKHLNCEWPFLKATEFMDFCRTGNRMRFEDRYFPKRRVLNALILAECVENRGRFLDDIINGIYSICEESGWNLPAHNYRENGSFPLPDLTRPIIDLFACETGAVLATAIYMMKPVLTGDYELVTRRVEYELQRRIFKPYLEEYFRWMGNGKDKLNNWTPWCTQNVLLAAFLSDTDEKTRRSILEKACQSVDYFLDMYQEDGCCDEGAQYYHHAGLCLSIIIQIGDAAAQGAFGKLYREEKIRNIAAYLFHAHVNDIYYVNFADCSPVAGRSGAREFLFARETQNPDMMAFVADDYRRGLPETMRLSRESNLFYRLQNAFLTAELKAYDKPVQTDSDVYYPSSNLMIVRDRTLVLAAKGGDNADSHNHNDVGSLTVYKDGKPLLIDVGVETYCRKTFSPQRYEIWTMQSSYHNLPEVSGKMQLPGEEYRATDVKCDLDACRIEMELADAYPADCGLRSYRRSVQLVKGEMIRLEDSFSWKDEHRKEQEIVLNLMTYEKPVPAKPGADGTQKIQVGDGKDCVGACGVLMLENAHVIGVDDIPITDERLAGAWKHEIHRIRIKPDQDSFAVKVLE